MTSIKRNLDSFHETPPRRSAASPVLTASLGAIGIFALYTGIAFLINESNEVPLYIPVTYFQPKFATAFLLSTFLVLYAILQLAKNRDRVRSHYLMSELSDINPDIIVEANLQGQIKYINAAAKTLLTQVHGRNAPTTLLLPPHFHEQIEGIIKSGQNHLAMEHHTGNQVIEYNIKFCEKNDRIFASGRNITQRRHIEQRLQINHTQLRKLNKQVEHVFSNFHPLTFDLSPIFHQMITAAFTSSPKADNTSPVCVFLCTEQSDDNFIAQGYHNNESEMQVTADRFSLHWHKYLPPSSRDNEVSIINIDEQRNHDSFFSLISQSHNTFNLSGIKNYAYYRTGRIGLIAFYSCDTITPFDATILKSLTIYSNALQSISHEHKSTDNAFHYAMDALARAAEVNDEETGSHITRINAYSAALATELGQTKEFVRNIRHAAQMHDVGKIHTPLHILRKPGALDNEEYRIMQQHTLAGEHILGQSSQMKMAAEIARSHHEKYDGSGYPDGLKGEEIPLSARIVAVADVYDTLRQKRVYKGSLSHNEAMHILTEGDEKSQPAHFDPAVLEALIRIQDKMDEIFNRFDG